MTPTLYPGDRLLMRYGAPVRPGDVVMARFPDGTLVVKRATERVPHVSGGPGWFLLSDNPDAEGVVDSRARGPVREDAVLAVVRRRVWPWRRRAS